ncbi:iron chaperone [Microbacterium sp. NC79]|uniref:iron chaperone n=1 Tax=Microbacterium sp. NC79 TaxID=2851009 RepID=UPI001C2CA489|nr:hypothetical protein [Microbacterium sp. NC79]MBV0894008.1 hypothetical protein [Microbacterium sp. NC79]
MAEKSSDVLSDFEKKALKERAAELKRQARNAGKREAGLKDLLDKVAEMPQPDRALAEKIHAIVSEHAPELDPKTWYSFPAYARDGKVMIFFQPAAKFEARYATLGFQDNTNLDDGTFWATSYAVTDITPAVEKQIIALVKKAIS